MICEPRISVMCDVCKYDDDFEMTALAGGGWDARNLPGVLKHTGWLVGDDRHVCPDCVEDGKS